MTKQVEIDFSRQVTNEAIQRAEDSANRAVNDWSERAMQLFEWFIERTPGDFMMEDFRNDVKGLLPEIPSNRAYGAIAIRAAHRGLIKKVGTGVVKNIKAHRCFASVWQKAK